MGNAVRKRDVAAPDSAQTMRDRFGALTLTMLNETPLAAAWSVNFLANFFVGPLYRDLAERFDMSRAQFVILYSLSRKPGLVARDICLATGLPKNSISRAVSELLDRRLIDRAVDADDRRAKPLMLTAKGRHLLEQVVPLFMARQDAMRAALTDEEKAAFDRLLSKMIDAMPSWVGAD